MGKPLPVAVMLVTALLAPLTAPAYAQNAFQPMQVFLQRGQPDRLQFVDLLTGEATAVETNGEQYTLFGRAVMYYDPAVNRVMLAAPDGRVRNHPFIQPLPSTSRVDWVVSADGSRVAWTLTSVQEDGQLITTTRVSGIDGSSPREALIDGPRPGIRALPVAFSLDQRKLYMDYQPDGIGDVTPFQQYAGLFEVDLESGETAMLPGEPGCFCGAGIGAGLLLRLDLAANLGGFDAVITNLAAGSSERIPAMRLANYTQAGGIIFSSDNTQAVYALAQVNNFGGPNQSVRTVFVLVDLVERTQSTLTQPINNFVLPVAWTENNTAVIFASADPTLDGTWKADLDGGRMTRVANATYLGTLK
jgi:hypothetical protein